MTSAYLRFPRPKWSPPFRSTDQNTVRISHLPIRATYPTNNILQFYRRNSTNGEERLHATSSSLLLSCLSYCPFAQYPVLTHARSVLSNIFPTFALYAVPNNTS